ncbi:MAG: FAD/FMN-containing dehydrogenase [Gammaproteobacteria bacterium]|jgi:FAD/FMN-containing dehydrogenase
MTERLQTIRDQFPAAMWLEADSAEQYSREQRGLFSAAGLLVARPSSASQVADLLAACNAANVVVVPRGGGTGLVGGSIAWSDKLKAAVDRPQWDDDRPAICLSLERLNSVLDVDPEGFSITVEAGVTLAQVQRAACEAKRYFPLSYAAEERAQIGGNLATNAGGINVLRYGNARDLCLGLEVATADGRLWNGLGALRKDNSGYDLKQLFIGSEGTLGVITAATLKLFPILSYRSVMLLGAPSAQQVVDALSKARSAFGDVVTGCELMSAMAWNIAIDHGEDCADPFEGSHQWYLLLELSGAKSVASVDELKRFAQDLGLEAVVAESSIEQQALWNIRRSIPKAQGAEGASIKHDISLPISSIPKFTEEAVELASRLIPGIRACPFGHLGDGNLHFNFTQPWDMPAEQFLSRWGELNRLVHDLVKEYGGSFAAEHGVGQLKTGEMLKYKSQVELDLMRTLKVSYDPKNILNPGKVLPPP